MPMLAPMTIDYTRIPEHMRPGVRRYVEKGRRPGDFLYHVLCNNLTDAFAHADGTNRGAMYEWAMFVLNELPNSCWGSEETVENWIESGGSHGIREESGRHEGRPR